MPLKFNRGTPPVLPTQWSLCHPVPVVRLTFSRRVSWLTKACAFWYAASQSPRPSIHLAGISRASNGASRVDVAWDGCGDLCLTCAGECGVSAFAEAYHSTLSRNKAVNSRSGCYLRAGVKWRANRVVQRTRRVGRGSRCVAGRILFTVSSSYTNKACTWDCTARKNGNSATTKFARSGNMSAALVRFSQRLDVE